MFVRGNKEGLQFLASRSRLMNGAMDFRGSSSATKMAGLQTQDSVNVSIIKAGGPKGRITGTAVMLYIGSARLK